MTFLIGFSYQHDHNDDRVEDQLDEHEYKNAQGGDVMGDRETVDMARMCPMKRVQ